MSAPRHAPPPRAGSGPRRPAAARSAHGRSSAAARAARPPAVGAPAARPPQPEATASVGDAPPLGAPGRLSPWQQLLAELDRLLRDPTLTRALKAFAAKLAAGLRGLPAVLGAVARSIGRLLASIRLPRRLLLGLLALLLPLALLALLTSSDEDRAAPGRAAPSPPSADAGATGGGLSLPAVGMPQLVALPDAVRPVRVALVVDDTYDTPALRRELQTLGGWLAANHAPGTRVSVIDARSARTSGPLDAARLGAAGLTRPRPNTAAAVRSALARDRGRRLLVTLGGAAPAPSTARTLQIATRSGATTGSSLALRRARRSRVTIDDRRPNALAASVARAIMAISGERERR